MNRFKRYYQEMLASVTLLDVEETYDLYFTRYLGWLFTKFAAKLGMTPYQVSFTGMFLGVVGGALLYFQDDLWIMVMAAVLIICSGILDSADGQLARYTNQVTELGRYIDGINDGLVFWACYLGGSLYLVAEYGWWILLLTGLGIHCLGLKAALADFYRMEYKYYVGPLDSERIPLMEEIEEYHAKSIVHKWLHQFTVNYTAKQHRLTFRDRKLRHAFDQLRGYEEFREMYRQKIYRMLTWWALVGGINIHRILIIVTALLGHFEVLLLFSILGIIPMLILERVQRRIDQEILTHFQEKGLIKANAPS
ncbi:MAG: CDP-alcohol phosphatidyltransferase family protein [Flammeovirgaceae bacterium]